MARYHSHDADLPLLLLLPARLPQPYDARAGGAWFPIHFFTQLLGSSAAIASYVFAMLLWFRKNSLGFERHVMYAPHCELGTGRGAHRGACQDASHVDEWRCVIWQ